MVAFHGLKVRQSEVMHVAKVATFSQNVVSYDIKYDKELNTDQKQ